jgi:NAD(P)-dependent dehydrogenase (short-subunit alcohol dehydrogenase family)
VIFRNFFSVVLLTQLATPYLEKTKGNIINVSSIAGLKAVGIQIFIRCELKNLHFWYFFTKNGPYRGKYRGLILCWEAIARILEA